MSLYYEISVKIYDYPSSDELWKICDSHRYQQEDEYTFTHRTTFWEDSISSLDQFCTALAEAKYQVSSYTVGTILMDSTIDDKLSLCHT